MAMNVIFRTVFLATWFYFAETVNTSDSGFNKAPDDMHVVVMMTVVMVIVVMVTVVMVTVMVILVM